VFFGGRGCEIISPSWKSLLYGVEDTDLEFGYERRLFLKR
jgi:hypothetical protein